MINFFIDSSNSVHVLDLNTRIYEMVFFFIQNSIDQRKITIENAKKILTISFI
jgi:hypothetical protein